MYIPLHYSVKVVDGFFHITHIRNSGVAFGLFANYNSEYKTLFFVGVSIIAIIAILLFFHHTPNDNKVVQVGLILVFSGAIGNLIDRAVHQEVIDFIDFFYKNFHWPAFNVADSCITIGVGLMIFDSFHRHPVPHSVPPDRNSVGG